MPTAIMLPRKINSTDAEDPLSCTSQKPDTSVDAHPFYLETDALLLGKKRCSCKALTFFYSPTIL